MVYIELFTDDFIKNVFIKLKTNESESESDPEGESKPKLVKRKIILDEDSIKAIRDLYTPFILSLENYNNDEIILYLKKQISLKYQQKMESYI